LAAIPAKMLRADDIAHVVAMLVTHAPKAFVSEVLILSTTKSWISFPRLWKLNERANKRQGGVGYESMS
jgi:hypothetical protein